MTLSKRLKLGRVKRRGTKGISVRADLWNFLYDKLLRLPTPDGVEIVSYVDDIAVVAQATVTFRVGELLEETAGFIVDWLAGIAIELALDKTEMIISTR